MLDQPPPRRWLTAMEAELVKQRMSRALKNCRDIESAFDRSACYAQDKTITPDEVDAFDLAAREIERYRRQDDSRLSFGERAAGILLMPIGIAMVGVMSLADDAAARSSKAEKFVDALDTGWGFAPMIFFIVAMIAVGALVLWKEPEDRG